MAFQLYEGDVMDQDFVNFIGIHLMNELVEEGEVVDPLQPGEEEEAYSDPFTGAHFEF